MLIVVEGVAVGDLSVDAPDHQVHFRQPPSRVVRLLPVDRDVADSLPLCASMNFSLLTNIPPEPQQGSFTRPLYGASISTRTRTTSEGV